MMPFAAMTTESLVSFITKNQNMNSQIKLYKFIETILIKYSYCSKCYYNFQMFWSDYCKQIFFRLKIQCNNGVSRCRTRSDLRNPLWAGPGFVIHSRQVQKQMYQKPHQKNLYPQYIFERNVINWILTG